MIRTHHLGRLAPACAAALLIMSTASASAQQAASQAVQQGASRADSARFRLLTLDPGHFHASLVQKFMYPDVDSTVWVYSAGGDDLKEHLARIETFNKRTDQPTHWVEKIYTGPDYLERMIADRKGNVVVIAGNNARKTEYIVRSIDAGLNVLADKPMVRTPEDLVKLRQAFKDAAAKHVLLYDIMTERNEVTTALQRELSMDRALFGTLQKGTEKDPAITKVSVHNYSKIVAGSPLKRPQWFFDVRQQGEGIVDVTTHLVDLVPWEAFPGQTLQQSDVKMLNARRWPTPISLAQFSKVTGADSFPDFLKHDTKNGVLQVYSNGEMNYTLRGIHVRVSDSWQFEGPAGSGDTHFSVMRGTKANLMIRQGAEQKYKPVLYVERNASVAPAAFEAALNASVEHLQGKWPGVAVHRDGDHFAVDVPAKYDVGHESHFAQVTSNFLRYLREGALPEWEVPNMLVKYATIMEAYKLSRGK
jgi:predicted dehydrogenase